MNTSIPGLAAWHMFSGGTMEHYGRHGYRWPTYLGNYVIDPASTPRGHRAGYVLRFENVMGALPGGLHQEIARTRGPQEAVRIARDHFAQAGRVAGNPEASAWRRGPFTYSSKAEAEAYAQALRASGYEAKVEHSPAHGTWSVIFRFGPSPARNPGCAWHAARADYHDALSEAFYAHEGDTPEYRLERRLALEQRAQSKMGLSKRQERADAASMLRTAGTLSERTARTRRNPGDVCDVCRVPLAPDMTCPKCGVMHWDPCPECGRRGYHKETCPVYIEESGASLSHLTERQARNPDDDPTGLPGWTKGLRHMLDRSGRPIWVSVKPVWGAVVTSSGKRRRTKFFRAYAMGPAGERIELPKILKDELVDPFGYTRVGKNPGKKRRGRQKRPFRVSDVKKWEKKTGVKLNPGTDMGSLMKHPGFRKALKLYRQIHGCDPKSVKRVILPVGDSKKITATDFFVALGKAPADSYEPNDRRSTKFGKIWVHPYDKKPIKAVDKTGKFIVTLPGSHAVKAGADGEAWIHGN